MSVFSNRLKVNSNALGLGGKIALGKSDPIAICPQKVTATASAAEHDGNRAERLLRWWGVSYRHSLT